MPAIVWKGYISFGLVSFPVRLYSAGRAESVHFHMLHRKDLSRVKEVWYCAAEDKPIERSEIVKGYEVGKDEYVVIDEEDLKKIAPPTASTMDILQFVKADEVDPIYFEHSYYVAADEKVGKPYSLFWQALKETSHWAIAKLSMHGRENIVLLRSTDEGLVLHTLFYPNELHESNRQAAPKSASSKKELDLAKSLVQHMAARFKPQELHDVYRENVEKMIEQKQKGQKVKPTQQPKREKVVDLMEALKQSLKTSAPGKPKAAKTRKAA